MENLSAHYGFEDRGRGPLTRMDDTDSQPSRHKIDVDAYHRMGEAGIFAPGERVELIEGELIDMAPIGQGHAGIVNRLNEALVLACRGLAIVSVQNPVRLDRYSEPQPDFALLRPRPDFYETGERAGSDDILLLIEVAESSLRFDRTVKLSLYARRGIPEYWIIDRRSRRVEVHTRPAEQRYRTVATHGAGARLTLTQLPEIVIDVDRILG